MADLPLLGCRECDLLQREAPMRLGDTACCARCGAVLYRNNGDSIDRTLAYTLAAVVLFVLANAFPIVGLEVRGQRTDATLFDAVRALGEQDMAIVALLVFVTTFAVPALQLAAICYTLLPLRLGRAPPALAFVMRCLHALRPWGMVEVFMLGVLVSLVRLARLAEIIPGIGLWSYGALIVLLAAAAMSFEPRDVWARVRAAG